MDETALIELAAQKDEQAWETLIRAHQQSVFRLAYLFTGDPDEAEDITQDSFIRAFRFIHKFDRTRSLRPWLLSIAANLARNRLRSFKRYLAALQNFARRDPEFLKSTFPDQSAKEDAQILWRIVRKLSQDDQQIIYLRYFLELSEDEAAAALDIPHGTVKSRLHRALKRLRDQLDVEGNEILKAFDHE